MPLLLQLHLSSSVLSIRLREFCARNHQTYVLFIHRRLPTCCSSAALAARSASSSRLTAAMSAAWLVSIVEQSFSRRRTCVKATVDSVGVEVKVKLGDIHL